MEELSIKEKVAIWRQKCKEGTITIEEMKEATKHLRENREHMIVGSKAKKAAVLKS